MAQSEREFNYCIAAKEADHYGHPGLAGLCSGWARRASTPEDEATEYLEKAEAVISLGLKLVKSRTSLLIVSSDIQRELGNQPARLSKLREAVASNSASTKPRVRWEIAYQPRSDGALLLQTPTPSEDRQSISGNLGCKRNKKHPQGQNSKDKALQMKPSMHACKVCSTRRVSIPDGPR